MIDEIGIPEKKLRAYLMNGLLYTTYEYELWSRLKAWFTRKR